MNAIIPTSSNGITIYNGRGLTRDDAYIGAIMEAVERQTAAECDLPAVVLTPRQAASRTIDLVRAGLRPEYADVPMPFVAATDLLTGEELIVPKALVQVPWRGVPAFGASHTNGLAAAFTRTDAIRNALYELVERHLWSVTHERVHLRPRRLLREWFGEDVPFTDDPVPVIAFPTGADRIDALYERILAAGLTLRVVSLCSDGFPPAMSASIYDRDEGRLHLGAGCDWSPAIAAIKAITEAVQARVADTHACRENIIRYNDPPSPYSDHTRRRRGLPFGRWYFDGRGEPLELGAFPDPASYTPVNEIRTLAECIRDFAPGIAMADLQLRSEGYFVARALVPELQSILEIVADSK